MVNRLVEPDRLNDVLKWEQENYFSREVVTVLSGQDLPLGAVIGKILKSIPATGTADQDNTGQGTMTGVSGGARTELGTYTVTCTKAPDAVDTGAAKGTVTPGSNTGNGSIGDVAVAAGAMVGDYTLECIEPATDEGRFRVEDPNGDYVGTAIVGSEFDAGGLTFTIADGDTDFVVGDSFTITVPGTGEGGEWEVETPSGELLAERAAVGSAYTSDHLNFTINDGDPDFIVTDAFTVEITAGSKKVKAIDFDAVDGTEIPHGLVIKDYDALEGDTLGVAIVREALIDAGFLAWPMEFTSGGTDVPVVGDVIKGATSADTAEIVKIALGSGSWAGGDAAGVLWLRKVSGEFQAENLDIPARSITDFATIAAGLTITANLEALAAKEILERTGA